MSCAGSPIIKIASVATRTFTSAFLLVWMFPRFSFIIQKQHRFVVCSNMLIWEWVDRRVVYAPPRSTQSITLFFSIFFLIPCLAHHFLQQLIVCLIQKISNTGLIIFFSRQQCWAADCLHVKTTQCTNLCLLFILCNFPLFWFLCARQYHKHKRTNEDLWQRQNNEILNYLLTVRAWQPGSGIGRFTGVFGRVFLFFVVLSWSGLVFVSYLSGGFQ